jgi:hypothetical protein
VARSRALVSRRPEQSYATEFSCSGGEKRPQYEMEEVFVQTVVYR